MSPVPPTPLTPPSGGSHISAARHDLSVIGDLESVAHHVNSSYSTYTFKVAFSDSAKSALSATREFHVLHVVDDSLEGAITQIHLIGKSFKGRSESARAKFLQREFSHINVMKENRPQDLGNTNYEVKQHDAIKGQYVRTQIEGVTDVEADQIRSWAHRLRETKGKDLAAPASAKATLTKVGAPVTIDTKIKRVDTSVGERAITTLSDGNDDAALDSLDGFFPSKRAKKNTVKDHLGKLLKETGDQAQREELIADEIKYELIDRLTFDQYTTVLTSIEYDREKVDALNLFKYALRLFPAEIGKEASDTNDDAEKAKRRARDEYKTDLIRRGEIERALLYSSATELGNGHRALVLLSKLQDPTLTNLGVGGLLIADGALGDKSALQIPVYLNRHDPQDSQSWSDYTTGKQAKEVADKEEIFNYIKGEIDKKTSQKAKDLCAFPKYQEAKNLNDLFALIIQAVAEERD